MLNRRSFLFACAGAGTAAPLAGLIGHAGAHAQAPSLQLFSTLVGARFDVADPASGRTLGQLTLVAVEPQRNSAPMIEQFSLHLASDHGHALAGDIYALRHPVSGVMNLRVERISPDVAAGGTAYRVDFALLRSAQA